MKLKLFFFLVLILLIVSCTRSQNIQGNPLDSNIKAELKPQLEGTFLVTKIIDGDTIELEDGKKVRLTCINAPEIGQYYSSEAQKYLSNLILNKKVSLEKDKAETDRYGRLLRYIYLDNLFVNDDLVLNGYAKSYRYPPDTRYCDKIEKSEGSAKSKGMGVWSTPTSDSCVYLGCPSGTVAVGSKDSDIWHYCKCKYAGKISKENLVCFKTTTEAEAKGYRETKVC